MLHGSPRVFSPEALRDLAERLLAAAGCGPEAAMAAADVLLEADLRGYGTHGLIRLPTMIRRIQSGMINPRARPRVVEERDASALVDADRALGPVGVIFGASLAARKAERAGCCAVGVVNCDHICMAGYYAERIARAGCVGLVAGVTQPLVHALGGAPTTDPAQAAAGALAPFGGHRGYGLCLFLGLLAGPLLGAKVGKPLGQAVREGHYDKGELVIAIDPAAFGDPADFRRAAAAHLAEVKASRRAAGAPAIRVPGERSLAERERRLREGVPIEEAVWSEVASLSEELGVPIPS